MKKTDQTLVLVFFIAIYTSELRADLSTGSSGVQFPSGNESGVPLDGGALELLLAGAVYPG
jgi:hypothetical protein